MLNRTPPPGERKSPAARSDGGCDAKSKCSTSSTNRPRPGAPGLLEPSQTSDGGRRRAEIPSCLVPPGPLSASRLKSDGLKLGSDYRAIGPSLYAYLVLCHGGGGVRLPRARGAVDLYALPAEQAQCVAAGVVAAFISKRARLRLKPAPPPQPPPPPRVEEDESDADERRASGAASGPAPSRWASRRLAAPMIARTPARREARNAEWPHPLLIPPRRRSLFLVC